MAKRKYVQCRSCYEQVVGQGNAYVYCGSTFNGDWKDFHDGTTHWVCYECVHLNDLTPILNSCFQNMKQQGTAGKCPFCRGERSAVSCWVAKRCNDGHIWSFTGNEST